MLKSIEKDGPERQRLSKTCPLDERHAGARRVQKNHAERGIRPGLPVPVFCQTALFFTLLARYFICEDQIIEIGPVRELRSYQIAKHSVSSFHMRARLPPFVYNNIPYGSKICKLYLCKITRKNCKRCRRAEKLHVIVFARRRRGRPKNKSGAPPRKGRAPRRVIKAPHCRCRQISNLHSHAGGFPIVCRCASNFRFVGGRPALVIRRIFGIPFKKCGLKKGGCRTAQGN